jgi:hypothetical protein
MLGKRLNPEFQKRWQEFLAQAQPPEWVRKMIEEYWRTGTYRPEDMRRLLGDPNKRVEPGLESLLAELDKGSS